MRYLRMFSNAAMAGAMGSLYVSLVLLQLNPNLPLYPGELVPLVATVGLSYGAHLTAVFYALIVVRQLFGSDVLSPGWISLRLSAWLFAAAALGGALLMWLNLREFGPMLERETARRMAAGTGLLALGALSFLAIAVVHYVLRRRGTVVSVTLLAVTAVSTVVLPLAARGTGMPVPLESRRLDFDLNLGQPQPPPAPRVVAILLDGASLDFLTAVTVEGRLPNFGKMVDSGASFHLATVRPTQPEPVWTSVATGKLPARTGVRSAARYLVRAGTVPIDLLPDYCFSYGLVRYGLLEELPHTAASVRVRTLWSILGGSGLSVGVVGWPLTYPAPPVRGFLVSDRLDRLAGAPLDPDDVNVSYPPEILPVVRNSVEARLGQPLATAGLAAWPIAPEVVREVFSGQPHATDRLYEHLWSTLEPGTRANFTAVRFRGIDAAGHLYLRYANPRLFGDVTDDEQRRYGRVLEASYAVVDAVIGRVMATLGADDLLIVVSGFGMEPLSPGKQLFERELGNPMMSGTHEAAPDGFVLAYGASVSPGRKVRGSVVDIAPTILYYLGLPVGRDMDGHARTDIFQPAFTGSRPITFIPTYDR